MTPIISYTYDAWEKPLSVVAAESAEVYDPGDMLHKQPLGQPDLQRQPQPAS